MHTKNRKNNIRKKNCSQKKLKMMSNSSYCSLSANNTTKSSASFAYKLFISNKYGLSN